MQSKSCVYWIHTPDQTDVFTEGYVGISVDGPSKRMTEHRSAAGNGSNLPVHNAIRKYGSELKMDVIVYADPLYCLDLEFKLRPAPNIGYNISVGGGHTNLGSKHSNATKDKISKAGKGRICKESTRALHVKNSTGRLHTEETKAKQRSIHKNITTDRSKALAAAAKRNSELPPWCNAHSNKTVWLDAANIYSYMMSNCDHGQRKISKSLKHKYSQLLVIYKKIKSGWNPLMDTEWLIFSSKLTPDTSGDKSLNPACADN